MATLVAVVVAAGCGSIAFKPGGTGGEQQAARDRCHSAGRIDSPDFERCMKEQGWSVRQLGDSPAAPGVKGAAEDSSPSVDVPAVAPSGAATPNAPNGDAPRPIEAPVEAPVAPAAAGAAESVDGAPVRTPTVVKGWFKLGGSADALESAKRRCAAKLGASAEPVGDANAVSPEMFDCLREEGWRAVP